MSLYVRLHYARNVKIVKSQVQNTAFVQILRNKHIDIIGTIDARQRWSPREPILKSLALASKPQVLENCPVLGSRTGLFYEWLKFCRSAEKFFSRNFFVVENTCVCVLGFEHSCPWPRECLSSEGLSLALASNCFCALSLGLKPCVLDSGAYFGGSMVPCPLFGSPG